MAKEMAKKAASAAMESTLLSLLPSIQEALKALTADVQSLKSNIGNLDEKIDGLREEMLNRFERTRDTINEVGQRVARVEGKLDVYQDTAKVQTNRMDQWIERLVKVEIAASVRPKRAS